VYTKIAASDQPVNITCFRPENQLIFASFNRRVSGKLHRRNQPVFKT
jgi:hypothetical protein